MYIRFHGNYASPYTKQPYGIFVVIYHLKRDGKLTAEDCAKYDDTVSWFEEHLPIPPYYKESNNAQRAVTWFKHTEAVRPLIDQLQPFFDIAGKYGVEILKSAADQLPGTIIYEDEYQVAVTAYTPKRE
ncbi:MAG: hypothetical protein K0Q59_4291 [Paenibacillus sp.]|nr:hypothetical protein [Paenibacillus sp.]